MLTKKLIALVIPVVQFVVPVVASANCCMLSTRVDTCAPKIHDTFTLAGQCWQAKCQGRGETPLTFVLSVDRCQFDPDSVHVHANSTTTACTTLQIAEELADIDSLKTECRSAAGVQRLEIRATDAHPADSASFVGCKGDGQCCGEAVCDHTGACCLPADTRCGEDAECCSGSCSGGLCGDPF